MGRILVTITEDHGIHAGDLPVVALWLLGTACVAILWRDAGAR